MWSRGTRSPQPPSLTPLLLYLPPSPLPPPLLLQDQPAAVLWDDLPAMLPMRGAGQEPGTDAWSVPAPGLRAAVVLPPYTLHTTLSRACTHSPSHAPPLSPSHAPPLSPSHAPTLPPSHVPPLPPSHASPLTITCAPSLTITCAPSLTITRAPSPTITRAPSPTITCAPSLFPPQNILARVP